MSYFIIYAKHNDIVTRQIGGSEKMDLGSDPMDLDLGSVYLGSGSESWVQPFHFVERSNGIIDLSPTFVKRFGDIIDPNLTFF